jgi:uncharacterized membrane protein YhaH (DUF805 family)
MSANENPYQSPKPAAGPAKSSGRKQRSTFWIVSTHVLTTGFAMPAVAGVAAYSVLSQSRIEGPLAFLITLAFQAVGYIGGTFYSFSYLRKQTSVANPQGCTTFSIITFTILAVIGLGLNIATAKYLSALKIAAWIIFYVVITIGFAIITKKQFAAMAEDPQAPQ